MSADSDLTAGIIDLIEAEGIAVQGASTGTAVVAKALNPSPDRGIAIVIGGAGDNALIPVGVRTVQFRTRGTTDTRDVDALAQQVFDLLHGVHGLVMGGTVLGHMYRTSFTSLGPDDPGRWERSDNYLANITELPSANRPG